MCSASSRSTSVSPPAIHESLTASIQVDRRHFTSVRSLATNLYFGVSVSPTIRWVTSEVRSNLWIAPIWVATSASSTCSGAESNQPESLANETQTVGWCRQAILTRFSGGIEVQHKMTPRRGFWARAICQSIVKSTIKSILLTRISIICHYPIFEEVS